MDVKENEIVIFKNDKKTKDSQPDFRGTVNFNGSIQEVSLWISESKTGLKYFKGKLRDPYQQDTAPAPVTQDTDPFLPF